MLPAPVRGVYEDFGSEGLAQVGGPPLVLQRRLEEAAEVIRWLAHDFGNVLMGVQGFAELCLRQVSSGSAEHGYVKEIQSAAGRGGELIRRLRLFCRTSAPHGVTGCFQSACEEEVSKLRARRKQLVEVEVRPSRHRAMAIHRDDFGAALAELLTNASEASGADACITVAARDCEPSAEESRLFVGAVKPGPAVEVSVTDNGRGLTAEIRAGLYTKPFFSTKPRHSGMGLPIVFGLLRACGGGFRLEAAEERGTVARLVLPAAVVRQDFRPEMECTPIRQAE
jgi:signal transduction histidine kinase